MSGRPPFWSGPPPPASNSGANYPGADDALSNGFSQTGQPVVGTYNWSHPPLAPPTDRKTPSDIQSGPATGALMGSTLPPPYSVPGARLSTPYSLDHQGQPISSAGPPMGPVVSPPSIYASTISSGPSIGPLPVRQPYGGQPPSGPMLAPPTISGHSITPPSTLGQMPSCTQAGAPYNSIPPPPMSASPIPPTMSRSDSSQSIGLPLPYHGQAQYSHQIHPMDQPPSEPVSARSSRAPSPLYSPQSIEELEGGVYSPGNPRSTPGTQSTTQLTYSPASPASASLYAAPGNIVRTNTPSYGLPPSTQGLNLRPNPPPTLSGPSLLPNPQLSNIRPPPLRGSNNGLSRVPASQPYGIPGPADSHASPSSGPTYPSPGNTGQILRPPLPPPGGASQGVIPPPLGNTGASFGPPSSANNGPMSTAGPVRPSNVNSSYPRPPPSGNAPGYGPTLPVNTGAGYGPPPPSQNMSGLSPPPTSSGPNYGPPRPPMSGPNYGPPPPVSSGPNYGPPPSNSSGPNYGPPHPNSSGPNYGPPPPNSSGPNYGPPLISSGPNYGPPPPSSSGPNYGPPPPNITGPTYGPPPTNSSGPKYGPPPPSSPSFGTLSGNTPGSPVGFAPNTYPSRNVSAVAEQISQMNLQQGGAGEQVINLLQERTVLNTLENQVPNVPEDYPNCLPEVFRCTLTSVPATQALLNKCRLPLGLLIHPFRDLAQLPVIQSNTIVRCRSCRTYINPFASFMDSRRWKCNLCYRVNEIPEEFCYDPVSKSYGDPHRRPEIRSATIEFIAPSEYMLRPPQPAAYVFVLDVSFNAVNTGYLSILCQTLAEELDRLPGDSRRLVAFITFDSCLHFYCMREDQTLPHMMVVSDIQDVFLPQPDGLLVNLVEHRGMILSLLQDLPGRFQHNMETGNCLGSALQAAYKLLSSTGGRVTVVNSLLPTLGAGALTNREDPNERSGKKVSGLGPATDFYKKLALDFSAQQIAVDLFLINGQYSDLATIVGVSKFSAGCVYYFPGLHTVKQPLEVERFEATFRRYLVRKIGFEAVMRIRCTRGISMQTFHGNFFVRSTDLLSLPNVDPDSGFGVQLGIEDTLECGYVCFQAALLYTSSKGERRIRVHTLCCPVSQSPPEIFKNADQQAIIALIAKMGADRCMAGALDDAREGLVNAAVDLLTAYGATLPVHLRANGLALSYNLRALPLFLHALMKSIGFRVNISTKLDDRLISLEQFKNEPCDYLIRILYPPLYPIHIEDAPRLQLSVALIDRTGAYIMDLHYVLYLWVGANVSQDFLVDVLDVKSYSDIQDGLFDFPELENPTSERVRNFISQLHEQRPIPAPIWLFREDSRDRTKFLEHLYDDRTESSMSYPEFLQYIRTQMK